MWKAFAFVGEGAHGEETIHPLFVLVTSLFDDVRDSV